MNLARLAGWAKISGLGPHQPGDEPISLVSSLGVHSLRGECESHRYREEAWTPMSHP